jgi:hypothetical protein
MKLVSRFEADLLNILRFFLGRVPAEQALPLVVAKRPPPPCLSRAAVELVQDSLAKGCVLWLVRAGGWRRERHLREAAVVPGRLWERTPPQQMALSFSAHTLHYLIWITACDPVEEPPQPATTERTIADLFLLYLVYRSLRETKISQDLRRPPFSSNPLCRLAYPGDFEEEPVDFTPWTTGVGGCVLEAVQPELARRWLTVERSKARIETWSEMQALGQAQESVLTAFLAALETAGRRDLARFLLACAAKLLTEDARPDFWVGGLASPGVRMAERAATHRAALTFLHGFNRLQQWSRAAQHVGYLDEDYAASQLWKADWEQGQGDILHSRSRNIIQQLEPFALSSTEMRGES